MEFDRTGHEHGSARRDALLRRQLLLGGDFSAAAELFRLLDDSSRLRIFWLLCHMEACVANISAVTGMSSPAVSHHLRLLKEAGLVRSRREGKEVRYRAADTPACKLSEADILRLHAALNAWDIPVTDTGSFADAQVMEGGLSTDGFCPETLESRLCPGLYACGEALDVTGYCGGHNLTWAWASGSLAGREAANSL